MRLSASLAAAGLVCGVVAALIMGVQFSRYTGADGTELAIWVAAGTISGAIIGAAGDITREIRRGGR